MVADAHPNRRAGNLRRRTKRTLSPPASSSAGTRAPFQTILVDTNLRRIVPWRCYSSSGCRRRTGSPYLCMRLLSTPSWSRIRETMKSTIRSMVVSPL